MTARVPLSRLVRWCPEGKTWQPTDEPVCNWDHDGKRHRLRLRRAVVCPECQQAYFSTSDYLLHECGDAA